MFRHSEGFTNCFCGAGVFFPGPLGMMATLLFWGFVIGTTFWLLQLVFTNRSSGNKTTAADNSLNILNERYARGEIGKDAFDRMKEDLR
jgi:putative membrane protein